MRNSLPLEKSFDPALVKSLLAEFGASCTPQVSFGGDLIFYKDPFPKDGNIPGIFTAIHPIQDTEVFKVHESLVEDRWLRDEEYGLVIGHWLVEDIGARVGNMVIVETQTKDGYAQVFDLEIVGIINSPNPKFTRSGMFLPLSIADELLEMEGMVTEMNVPFNENSAADSKFAALIPKINEAGLEALNWQTPGEDFISMSQAEAGSSLVIILLILIIAGVGISNAMLMAVYERVREPGMMRAPGMKDKQIRSLFHGYGCSGCHVLHS